MTLDAVVFDLDGVLVESEHLWEENWVAFAARHQVEWTAEDTASVQGMSAPEWAGYLARRCGVPDQADEVERAVVDGMIASIDAGEAPLLPGPARWCARSASGSRSRSRRPRPAG